MSLPVKAAVIEDEQCRERESTKVPLVKWQDDSVAPKGCVVLVHGLSQRGACLRELGTTLAARGYIVWAPDQRGHGFWHYGQKKGDDGYIADYMTSAKDLERVLASIKETYPDLRTVCIGESAGSAIIARAAVDTPQAINGMVLCSSGVKCHGAKFTWIAKDLLCNFYRPNHPINIVKYQRKYGSDNKLDFSDQELDPWVRRSMSTRELIRTKKIVCGTAKVAKHLDPTIPLLVLQGSEDHVLKLKSVKKVMKNAPSTNKQYIVVQGCGHVMLGTNYLKPLVVSSINRFLDEQTSSQTIARASTGL